MRRLRTVFPLVLAVSGATTFLPASDSDRRAELEAVSVPDDGPAEIREEIAQTTAATSKRLGQQAEEIARTAWANLRRNVQQELPAIEKNVFARSQAQASEVQGVG